jgi:hypothetical protein
MQEKSNSPVGAGRQHGDNIAKNTTLAHDLNFLAAGRADLLEAIQQTRSAQKELDDRLFVLEGLLEAAAGEV